jgi:hypothetical protein
LEEATPQKIVSPEWSKCQHEPAHFIEAHVSLFNATNERWQPFTLWPAQREVLSIMHTQPRLVVLKARQLGLSWLCLAYALWAMLFRPAATIGIFSQRETDAKELLNNRLKGMYDRLPEWAQVGPGRENNSTRWSLANGSSATAFATTGGRGHTFSLVLVDEADFQPDLPDLLNAVEPTVNAGGRLWLVSTVDKSTPMSRFKAICRAAQEDATLWTPVFLPWSARPERTPEWYAQQAAATLATTGALDDLWQEYPSDEAQALAPRSLDKRLPHAWLIQCYEARKPLPGAAGTPELVLPELAVYALPMLNQRYVIGADPAEGNPTSDESAACVLDAATGEEMAMLAGRFEPSVFAGYLDRLSQWYADAPILVERNNHGHAVLLWLRDNSRVRVLLGKDGRPGWQTTSLSKTTLYAEAADALRDGELTIHGLETFSQLASIDGASLSAPKGLHDDRAMALVLAHMGRIVATGRAVRARSSVRRSRAVLRAGRIVA